MLQRRLQDILHSDARFFFHLDGSSLVDTLSTQKQAGNTHKCYSCTWLLKEKYQVFPFLVHSVFIMEVTGFKQ